MRTPKLKRYKFYIVDATIINKIFAYNKGFMSQSLAKETRDSYLSPSLTLSIMSGTEVYLNRIPLKPASFSLHKPYVLRRVNLKDRAINYKKRNRIKGTGIVTHLFKRVWNPLPDNPKDRKSALLKDRDKIRNKILK